MSTRLSHVVASAALAAVFAAPSLAHAADTFTYEPAGQLVTGSGKGRVDAKAYAPSMRFPMETGPAFANSQVWGHGGNEGPTGTGQCDKANFSYPWHDNYCESRSYDMPLCPAGQGHQGQDIRAASCVKDTHWVVAVVDGTITSIGTYSVYLTAADGTRYDYLHMSTLQVTEGQKVKTGDRVGKVSNQFNGTPTTVHLHMNIRQNVAGVGSVYVPTYMSLIGAYERLLGIAKADAGAPDAAPPATPEQPPKTVAETPVTPPPAEPEPPPAAVDSGCTAAPSSGGPVLFPLLASVAAAIVIAARRRRRTN